MQLYRFNFIIVNIMATWRLETLDKKSVYEREFWKKDGIRVEVVTGYRWG